MLPSVPKGRSRWSSHRLIGTQGERMPARATRDQVDVFVEIPRGSRAKYELDAKTGHIRLDPVLPSSVHYSTDDGGPDPGGSVGSSRRARTSRGSPVGSRRRHRPD